QYKDKDVKKFRENRSYKRCVDIAEKHEKGILKTYQIVYQKQKPQETIKTHEDFMALEKELKNLGYKIIEIRGDKSKKYHYDYHKCVNQDKVAMKGLEQVHKMSKKCREVAIEKHKKTNKDRKYKNAYNVEDYNECLSTNKLAKRWLEKSKKCHDLAIKEELAQEGNNIFVYSE
ncbi:MAG: hypothetical protein JXQ76_10970, partial [Campylobacterales bacterium]|nr:hypothetical protein [Campylobacterales bacterium]